VKGTALSASCKDPVYSRTDRTRSSGYMCVKGWKMDRFNPSKIPVVTHEMDHEPEFLDLRGGPKSAGETSGIDACLLEDHVDILGRAELNVSHSVLIIL
jgi:hypothetical protein